MHFLPYGSVVTLKDFEFPVMVTDWTAQVAEQDDERLRVLKSIFLNSTLKRIDKVTRKYTLFDYMGCPWPTGYIEDDLKPGKRDTSLRNIPFNHDDIVSILFFGPYDEIFEEHDRISFEFACENDMKIADLYRKGEISEFSVQKERPSRVDDYKFPQPTVETEDDLLLPIGSVVCVDEAEEGKEPEIIKYMICSVKPPYYTNNPDYEVFEWQYASIITDSLCLCVSNPRIIEVKSVGYVTLETQELLQGLSKREYKLPLLDEVMKQDSTFKI